MSEYDLYMEKFKRMVILPTVVLAFIGFGFIFVKNSESIVGSVFSSIENKAAEPTLQEKGQKALEQHFKTTNFVVETNFWSGGTDQFIVTTDEGKYMVQLNDDWSQVVAAVKKRD